MWETWHAHDMPNKHRLTHTDNGGWCTGLPMVLAVEHQPSTRSPRLWILQSRTVQS